MLCDAAQYKNINLEDFDEKLILNIDDHKFDVENYIEKKVKIMKNSNFAYVRYNYVTYLPQKNKYNT